MKKLLLCLFLVSSFSFAAGNGSSPTDGEKTSATCPKEVEANRCADGKSCTPAATDAAKTDATKTKSGTGK